MTIRINDRREKVEELQFLLYESDGKIEVVMKDETI